MNIALVALFQFCVLDLALSSSCPASTGNIKPEQIPVYYWRDYFGVVPDDAIQGGKDKAGNPTYIGQTYIKDFELLPATIFPQCRYVNTTAYGNELTTDKNIKILCAKHQDSFEWIPTKREDQHLITDCQFVVGGSEIGETLHIGRVNHDGRIVIGKIFDYPLPNSGLAIPYNGKPIVFLSYEILAYNCPKSKKRLNVEIDYYWRDYVGIIPDDAIPGGTDKAGNPTYVGQAYIRNLELLPVIIYPGCKYANTTAYANEVTTDKNIKILCSKYKEKFEWVATKNDETHLLTHRHLVVGGSEIGHTLNIGRVQHDGQIIVGKVFSYPLDNSGLWIPYNGVPIRFVTYEILTFDQHRITKSNSEIIDQHKITKSTTEIIDQHKTPKSNAEIDVRFFVGTKG